MNILLDVNTIIDVLIPERGFQSKAVNCLNRLKEKNISFIISASSVDTITFILTRYLKDESASVQKLREFLGDYNVKIISVTGMEFKGLEQFTDIEDAIISRAARRVDEDIIVLTRDKTFDSQGLKTADYDKIERLLEEREMDRKVSLLDLKRGYVSSIPVIRSSNLVIRL